MMNLGKKVPDKKVPIVRKKVPNVEKISPKKID
jgi:hypothetical protein